MDPVTTATAGISLYQAGGLALLLLGMGAVGVSIMAKWFMGQVSALGGELRLVRTEMQTTLVGVIRENTKSAQELRAEVAAQTVVISQQNNAMRDRPCLVDTGAHRAQTPLPQLRHSGA